MLIHNIPYYNNISAHIGAGAQWLSAIWGYLPNACYARLRTRADMHLLITLEHSHHFLDTIKVKNVILS